MFRAEEREVYGSAQPIEDIPPRAGTTRSGATRSGTAPRCTGAPLPAASPDPRLPDERALVRLSQAIRPLGTVASFMSTGAHPDDERSALLAYYSRGLGVRTLNVIANRGEGGQNEVGDEHSETLGVVRTRELQRASRTLGVYLRILSEELHDTIYDFGFSKTAEETIEKWGGDPVLERLVRTLRRERPDVVMPCFRDEHGRHGHHRAINRLTFEAVRVAADPEAFPEQIAAGLRPWRVRKGYVPANLSGEGGPVYLSTDPGEATVIVEVGKVDDVTGLSYAQLGEESRAYHRTQGMGRSLDPGGAPVCCEWVFGERGATKPESEGSMFDGLSYTVADLSGGLPDGCEGLKTALLRIQQGIDAVIGAFPRRVEVLRAAQHTLAEVRELLAQVDRYGEGLPRSVRDDLTFRLEVKEGQLQEASAVAALLSGNLTADAYEVVRGRRVTMRLSVMNGGPIPLHNPRLELVSPEGWPVESRSQTGEHLPELRQDQVMSRLFDVTVPDEAALYHPYRPPKVHGVLSYELWGIHVSAQVEMPRDFAVLPAFSLDVDPPAALLNTREEAADTRDPLPLSVNVRNQRPEARVGSLRLEPLGTGRRARADEWLPVPSEQEFDLNPGAVETYSFAIRPPVDLAPGIYDLRVVAEGAGASSSQHVRTIEYEHIGRTHVVTPAEVRVVAFPWGVARVRVGYVGGGFDSVAVHLRRMGFEVEPLGAERLRAGAFDRYETIVIGVYAYRFRPDLRTANDRLLSYVRDGGHLVVLLHRPHDEWNPDRVPPHRLVIGRPSFNWRVTDEGAPVTVLEPAHPIFHFPNRIQEADWAGWRKERGLYFPMEWSEEYTPLVSVSDPGWDPMHGGMLLASCGEGSYMYTSLNWHYQLERHIPGAYRLMANMVSFPARNRSA